MKYGYVGMIINVEAQNKFYPGYPLIKRGIYYGGRMLSAQKNVDFFHSHYEDIKKVCSIWLCTNPPKNRQNTITEYRIVEQNIVGTIQEKKENYDLMSVIMVCLGELVNCDNELLRLLNVILKSNMKAADRKEILEKEFRVEMTGEMEEEVNRMCNLSEGILEDGIEKGTILKLQEQIQKKLAKGKSIELIAEELEETVETIQRIRETM